MQIETEFWTGNIVFFYIREDNKIMKGIVDQVRTLSNSDCPCPRIFYQIGVYEVEEDAIAKTVDELRNKLHARIDRIFEEGNIKDYALEQLAQF